MDRMTSEFLFYGGIIIPGCALVAAILYFCISKVKSIKLKMILNTEYGEEDK